MHWHMKCMSGRNQAQIFSPFLCRFWPGEHIILAFENACLGSTEVRATDADHWSILMWVLAWWAHNTGIWKRLLGVSWSARDQTQIIGPFWCGFWLGEHIILAFENACLGSAEVRATKRRSLVHFDVGSDLVSTLWWLLSAEFGHMTRITSVIGLTCCTFADSFLKHSPC